MTASMALLFEMGGTLYCGDLPIYSFARRAGEYGDPGSADRLIGTIRALLEHPDRLAPPDAALLAAAEDGHHAVEILAAALGIPDGQAAAAYRASCLDLAATAFALDPVPGLRELLAELGDHAYVAVTARGDFGSTEPVLDAVGLAGLVDGLLTGSGSDSGIAEAVPALVRRMGGEPSRVLVAGTRWTGCLAVAHAAGCATALVDRFQRGLGDADFRGPESATMIPDIRRWAAGLLADGMPGRASKEGVGRDPASADSGR